MKRAAFLVALALAACRTPVVEQENPYAHRPDAAMAGAKLFREHCSACHGSDANGRGSAPSLRAPGVQARSDAALFAFITNGDLRHGMPSWSRLTDDRRWQIVTYLRSLTPSETQLERHLDHRVAETEAVKEVVGAGVFRGRP